MLQLSLELVNQIVGKNIINLSNWAPKIRGKKMWCREKGQLQIFCEDVCFCTMTKNSEDLFPAVWELCGSWIIGS